MKCLNCGQTTDAATRCTNGHCVKCHGMFCTSGGAREPGHGRRVFAVESPTGQRVFVQAGTLGYFQAEPETWAALHALQSPQMTNAALAGSLFGWDCPAADPASYHADGRPVSRKDPR